MSENYTDRETIDVYNLVKEYLKKKPFFSISEILSYLNHRLKRNPNINKTKTVMILKCLIKENLIIPGTKLVREDILKVPKRKQIYEYITNNPGTNITEIKKNLGLGSNQVLWHLKFLEKFQFIRCVTFDNQKTLFKFQLNERNDKILFYLGKESVKKIIELMKFSKEGLKPTKIRNLLKMHYYTIKKYLDVLYNLNLIIIDYGKNSYKLNHKVYNEVLKDLNNVLD